MNMWKDKKAKFVTLRKIPKAEYDLRLEAE